MIDFVMLVLGELSDFRSPLNIQHPQVPIVGSDGTVLETVATDVADHIMLQGILGSGAPFLSPSVADLHSRIRPAAYGRSMAKKGRS